MPKSTNKATKVIGTRVPVDMADYYRALFRKALGDKVKVPERPISTSEITTVINNRVPLGTQDYYKGLFLNLVLKDKKDELYLFIKRHPLHTVDQVVKHFYGKRFINRNSVTSMCKKTGLNLADYPPAK